MVKHKFELEEDLLRYRPSTCSFDMLDKLLCGKKLWDYKANPQVQKKALRRVHKQLEREHAYMLEHEPLDEFHACVLLGALNLVAGLLKE